jgi:AcrR family transcriptional regulator
MESKDKIRKAAFELFALKGLNEATTESIARAAGLKKQSLYSHYKSKNELILDVLREQAEIINSALEETLEDLKDAPIDILLRDVFERLVVIFSNRTRLLLWKRVYLSANVEEIIGALRDSNLCFDRKLFQNLFALIGKRYPEFADIAVFRTLFSSYYMAIQGYLDWMLQDSDNAAGFNYYWRNIWHGLECNFSV